jgi:hypothetical protein
MIATKTTTSEAATFPDWVLFLLFYNFVTDHFIIAHGFDAMNGINVCYAVLINAV